MWRKLVAFVIIIVLTLSPIPVLAVEIEVTVTAKPAISGGITDFTIIYVSETQLDFSWAFSGGAVNIMIRGKYDGYADNIPNPETEPSDGYLVYYGSATTCSDTSMDFDNNPGAIYYTAWAQRADGTWYTNVYTGEEESAIMTLLGFIVLALGLSFLGAKSSYWILKFLAGAIWWVFGIYWINYPPSVVTEGSSTDKAVIVFLFITGAVFWLWTFWNARRDNGVEVGGRLRFPFMKTDEQEAEYKARTQRVSRSERVRRYQDRVDDALNGRVRRR